MGEDRRSLKFLQIERLQDVGGIVSQEVIVAPRLSSERA